MKLNRNVMTLTAAIILAVSTCATFAQTPEPPSPPPPAHQGHMGGDPIRQLNLTQQQQEDIRNIREKNREERAAINRRLAEANRALQEALEVDSPVEALVEQRMKAVADEQAAAMRMRILTEVRVRQVLTQEQRAILRNLRLQAQQMRRERRRGLSQDRPRREERREERLQRMRERRRPAQRPMPGPIATPQATPTPQ